MWFDNECLRAKRKVRQLERIIQAGTAFRGHFITAALVGLAALEELCLLDVAC